MTPRDGWHYWFGYYDKCPWSSDGQRLLAHRARFCDRFPSGQPGSPPDQSEGRAYSSEIAEVGYIEGWDTDSPGFITLAVTRAWNWQQGAMLSWTIDHLGAPAIRFNDRREGVPISRTVRIDGSESDSLGANHLSGRAPTPAVYAVHEPTGRALTLCFARLSRLRPEYGYPGLVDPRSADPSPADDGIYRIERDGLRLLISIDQLDRFTGDGSARAGGTLHQHVNHIMFNPSGTRFCFMHRFERQDGILHSRLFTSDIEGRDVRLLFEGMCSHYDWRDDHTILAWAGRRSLLGSAGAQKNPARHIMTLARRGLKPVYYALGKPRILMNKIMKDSYLLISDVDVRNRDAPAPLAFARGELTCDGHCTFNRGGSEPGRWVLTDGYPDLKSRQPLFLWDCRENIGYEIGRFPTPRHLDGPIRVDLHPRFNLDATLVCIDSAMEGERAMYVVDVRAITNK